MIHKPDIVCVQDAAHARKMLKHYTADAPLILLCVRPEREEPRTLARLAETLYRTAQSYNAELALLFSNEPALAAAQFIRRRGARRVIVDAAQETAIAFSATVQRWLPRVQIVMQGEHHIAEVRYAQEKYCAYDIVCTANP